jgi:hypothetical protein
MLRTIASFGFLVLILEPRTEYENICGCSNSQQDVNQQNMLMDTAPSVIKYPQDQFCGTKNGECWSAFASCRRDMNDPDTITIHGMGHEESLAIKIKFNGVGTYHVTASNDYFHGSTVMYYLTLGGDVIISIYDLESESTVEITKYDPRQQIIEGTFDFKMKRRPRFAGSDGPDEVVITNGSFVTHIGK